MMTNKDNTNIQKDLTFYIIVPVFNASKFLDECIESVLSVKTINLIIILVDDGSTDESGEKCDNYARLDNRVIVFHQKNQGQIIARQTGINYVLTQCNNENDVVMFLDSDDSLKQMALTEVNKVMSDLSIDMMIFGMDRVYDGTVVNSYNGDGRCCGIVEKKKDLYRIVFNDWTYNPVCAKAIRFTLLESCDYKKYEDIRYGEDLIQSIEYYKKSKKVYFYNKSLYNYTINPNSLTQSINNKPYSVDFRVRQLVMNFLIDENEFDEQDWIQYRTYCMWLVTDMLRTICFLNIGIKEKIKFINEIFNSEYYSLYLRNKECERLEGWWNFLAGQLFSKKRIITIAVIGSIYKQLRQLRNRIRGDNRKW